MVRIIVKKLLWDSSNIEHIEKHKVSKEEAEQAGTQVIAVKVARRGCYLLIGRSGTRIISVVVVRRDTGIYYVVTARDADKKERRRVYDKEKKQDS